MRRRRLKIRQRTFRIIKLKIEKNTFGRNDIVVIVLCVSRTESASLGGGGGFFKNFFFFLPVRPAPAIVIKFFGYLLVVSPETGRKLK